MAKKQKRKGEDDESGKICNTITLTPTFTITQSGSTDYMFLQVDISLKKETMEAEIVEIKEICRCSKHLAVDKLKQALSYYIRDM